MGSPYPSPMHHSHHHPGMMLPPGGWGGDYGGGGSPLDGSSPMSSLHQSPAPMGGPWSTHGDEPPGDYHGGSLDGHLDEPHEKNPRVTHNIIRATAVSVRASEHRTLTLGGRIASLQFNKIGFDQKEHLWLLICR